MCTFIKKKGGKIFLIHLILLINFGYFQHCNMMCKAEPFCTLLNFTYMYAEVFFGKLLQKTITLNFVVVGEGKDKLFLHELEVSTSLA